MTDQTYHLEDRYTAERSHVFMSGIQALARLPIEQLLADRRDGLRTAAFVCGYPGSPLGGFDGCGRSPDRRMRPLRSAFGSGEGTDDSSDCVYGW